MKGPFIQLCEADILRRSVIVCCGKKDALEQIFFDPEGPFKGFDVTHADHSAAWAHLAKAWDEHVENPGKDVEGVAANGFCYAYGGDVFLVMPEWSRHKFVHEAFHAAHAMLRIIGTDDEELGAYLAEWLYEQLCPEEEGK